MSIPGKITSHISYFQFQDGCGKLSWMLIDKQRGHPYNDVTSELQGLLHGRLATSVVKKMYGAFAESM